MAQLSWRIAPELESTIRAKKIHTARDLLILHALDVVAKRPDGPSQEHKLITRKDGDKIFLCFPDGPQHEARAVPAVKGIFDRIFWVNLLIACDGPDYTGSDARGAVTRNYGKLENAVHDLDAFSMYYMPMRIGDPTVVYTDGVGRSPGYFDFTKRLNNPSAADVKHAICEIRKWISVNSEDPEFKSVQFNFTFAGHGYGGIAGESGIVISDGEFSCAQIGQLLLDAIPPVDEISSPFRLDMYLDCCHSGAIARDVLAAVMDEQELNPTAYASKSKLGLGKVFCACLDDESSLEVSEVKHGLFSFGFLNEFSRLAPEDPVGLNLALRDVGWYSEMQQHPFLFDNTIEAGPNHFSLMYPSAKLLDNGAFVKTAFESAYAKATQEIIAETQPRNGEIVLNPLAIVVRALHFVRETYQDIEKQIFRNPTSRQIFKRTEYYDREKLW